MPSMIPDRVGAVLTPEVALEMAAVYGDQPIFPGKILIDQAGGSNRRFPGWPGSVLVIADENQGVCSWGVPVDDSDLPVLVGGELLDAGRATMRYATNIETFVAARRWDRRCLEQEPLLQAQAAELDAGTLAFLRASYTEQMPTYGWPWSSQFRFERGDITVMLWSGKGQCDWWISGPNSASLDSALGDILKLSNLRTSLWSNDPIGIELLQRSPTARDAGS